LAKKKSWNGPLLVRPYGISTITETRIADHGNRRAYAAVPESPRSDIGLRVQGAGRSFGIESSSTPTYRWPVLLGHEITGAATGP